MSQYPGYVSAGADFDDSGFFDQNGADNAFRDSLLEFTTYGDGYNVFGEPQQRQEEEVKVEGDEFFSEAFVQHSGFNDTLTTSLPPLPTSPSSSPSPSEAFSDDSAVSLSNSLDDVGINTLNNNLITAPVPLTTSDYTPHPHILANQPASPPDPNALYAPLTTSHFRSSAEAKAHRKRARLAPKSQAKDIARVKTFGRNYWVCRIFNAMIYSQDITDSANSIHRTRFTKRAAFDALDLEAAAHAVFDEAIAVHERGWNRPKVYHKHTVRGKLVDVSETSLELRLSRICLVLKETKSAVDDAIRGGVTLALLCDNPEARRFTKESNNAGNQKRGERLKQTAAKERAREAVGTQDVEEVESQEQVDAQEVSAVSAVRRPTSD